MNPIEKIIDLLTSKTALAGLLAGIASTLAFFGVDVGIGTPEQQEGILALLAGVGGFLAIVFRAVATKKIGGGSLE